MYDPIEYRGYYIHLEQEPFAENPFEDWGCCNMPIYVLDERGYEKGYGLDLDTPKLTRQQIKDNIKELLALVGCRTLLTFLSEYGYSYRQAYGDLVEYFNDSLPEYVDKLTNTDKLIALCIIYKMLNIPAYTTTVQGHSQSQWADVLVVATPEWQKLSGCNEATEEMMHNTAKLYGYWAFGDVWGYQIHSDEEGESDIIDSCGGFYTDSPDDDENLLEHAKNAIDCHIEWEKKNHFKQLKTWIKNRVPMQHRQALAV